MAKLKPETIGKIRDVLRFDVDDRKARMMKMIEQGYDGGLSERIAEYRAAFSALEDFEEWADEQEG